MRVKRRERLKLTTHEKPTARDSPWMGDALQCNDTKYNLRQFCNGRVLEGTDMGYNKFSVGTRGFQSFSLGMNTDGE